MHVSSRSYSCGGANLAKSVPQEKKSNSSGIKYQEKMRGISLADREQPQMRGRLEIPFKARMRDTMASWEGHPV